MNLSQKLYARRMSVENGKHEKQLPRSQFGKRRKNEHQRTAAMENGR